MRQKKVWRYYCEYCKKAGCGKAAMVKHERGCTMNPNRICGFHKLAEFEPQLPIADLIGALTKGGFKELRQSADNCPVCILAALRQAPSDAGRTYIHREEIPGFLSAWDEPVDDGRDSFDFKAEMKSIWNDINEARHAPYY